MIAVLLSACSTIATDDNKNINKSNSRIYVKSEEIYGIWERVGILGMNTSYMAILNGCNVGRIYFSNNKVRLNQKEILQAINGGMIDGGKVTTWRKCNVSSGKFMQIPSGEHAYIENYLVYRDDTHGRVTLQDDEISLIFFYPNWSGGPRPPMPPPPERYRRVLD